MMEAIIQPFLANEEKHDMIYPQLSLIEGKFTILKYANRSIDFAMHLINGIQKNEEGNEKGRRVF